MLGRRKFLARIGSFAAGLGFACPSFWAAHSLAATGCTAPAVDLPPNSRDQLTSLLAVEAWEDLLDNIDCSAVVGRYVDLDEDHASLFRLRGRCPFCQALTLGVYEYEDSFYCESCEISGTAVDFLCHIERLPYEEAVRLAKRLLHSGSFRERASNQHNWFKAVEAVASWSRHILLHGPEGAATRQWLRERGVSGATQDRFQLGVMMYALSDRLILHMQQSGAMADDLSQSVMEWAYARDVEQSAFAILIPCKDATGNCLGFFEHHVSENGSEHSTARLSPQRRPAVFPNRLRRLLFPVPNWPQDFRRHRAVLLAQRPWDVVVLHNSGLTNAVYAPAGMAAKDSMAMRTALAVGEAIVYPISFQSRRDVSPEGVMKQLSRDYPNVHIMNLEGAETLSHLLYRHGSYALQDAMDKAIPLERWLHC
jgi:hypothetical protein